MKNLIRHIGGFILLAGLFFACRGGVHKNNDHDYDGRNENNDQIDDMSDQAADTVRSDSVHY